MATKKQNQESFFETVKNTYLQLAVDLFDANINVCITPAEYDYLRSLTAFPNEDAVAMQVAVIFGLELGSIESEKFLEYTAPLLEMFRSEKMEEIDEHKLKTSIQSAYKNAKASKSRLCQITEAAKKQKNDA